MEPIYVFYADVFLIQNFWMDYLALLCVTFFLNCHKSWIRLFLTAFLASLFSLLAVLLIRTHIWYQVVMHVFINTGMIILAFGKVSVRRFISIEISMYLVIMLLGGVMEWLWSCTFFPRHFMLMSTVAFLVIQGFLWYLGARKKRDNLIVSFEIHQGKRKVCGRAFYDTGNQLVDPYTMQEVFMLRQQLVEQLFGGEAVLYRYVPYASLGETEGLLAVTTVDKLMIYEKGKTTKREHVAIGAAKEELFLGKTYDMILHAGSI